ncbi:DUF6474 family protein [Mycobacterium tuberculosis]
MIAAMAARGLIDRGAPISSGSRWQQTGRFSGHGARLSARVGGAERSLRMMQEKKPKPNSSCRGDQSAHRSAGVVAAAEHMPAKRRWTANSAIPSKLAGIEADLMARFGLT